MDIRWLLEPRTSAYEGDRLAGASHETVPEKPLGGDRSGRSAAALRWPSATGGCPEKVSARNEKRRTTHRLSPRLAHHLRVMPARFRDDQRRIKSCTVMPDGIIGSTCSW